MYRSFSYFILSSCCQYEITREFTGRVVVRSSFETLLRYDKRASID